jgi:Na+/citrate or Na+/malate symporter
MIISLARFHVAFKNQNNEMKKYFLKQTTYWAFLMDIGWEVCDLNQILKALT